MAMRKSSRRELQKLRELVHVLIQGKRCCFCKKLLMEEFTFLAGDGLGPKLTEKITVHHQSEDHYDNDPRNWKLAHQACHKAHHIKKSKPWLRR